MSASSASSAPALAGQTVVVIGGSSGMGLETARQARSQGANVVLTGRDPQRLEHAARELGALSSAAFDATDFDRLGQFLDKLPSPIDHIMVTAGAPYYARLADIDFAQARHNVDQELCSRSKSLAGPPARFARAGHSCSSAEREVAGRPRPRSSRP
jgi:NADP-dependent 3-hydroxy acid dehydrogenase YdfG